MAAVDALLEQKLGSLKVPLALTLPGGRRIGAADAAVTLRLNDLGPLASIATGQMGRVGQDYVEGRVDFDGSMRDLMTVAWKLIGDDPTRADDPAPLQWWRHIAHGAKVEGAPRAAFDARQVSSTTTCRTISTAVAGRQAPVFLRLLPEASMTLEQAQEAKLDHICKKLMLRRGNASSTSARAGAACCCGPPRTTACGPTASPSARTSTPMLTG